MIWDREKAKIYLHKMGMDHIKNGLKSEGADLIYAANFGNGSLTQENFILTIKRICKWEDEDLKVASFEAMYPVFI